MKRRYRLGLDLGASSLGWAILEIDEFGNVINVIALGSRIFSDGRDPQSKTPLSVERTQARGARRNRDRYLMRRSFLVDALRKFELMPRSVEDCKCLEIKNPYKLRAKGVHEKLKLFELGRALFHINQRRGFKSNRHKVNVEGDKKSPMINSISTLRVILNDRTLGEYLYERMEKKQNVRMRNEVINNKTKYEMYADRQMYEEEFHKLWDCQAKFYPELTKEKKEFVRNVIFNQRSLKIPKRGKCRFENLEDRAYAAYPISQAFRIMQEVNNLEIVRMDMEDPFISEESRQKLIKELLQSYSKYVNKTGFITFRNIKKCSFKLLVQFI